MAKNKLSLEKEQERIRQLKRYELEAYAEGYKIIAGLDEVGRGPLAGPVVAAAVILPADFFLPEVDDSKKLGAKKRQKLAAEIKREALDWSVSYVFPPYLDELNILGATKHAMINCVDTLNTRPDFLLIDALFLDDINIKQLPLVKGDTLSVSIACASIIAKVERDQSMAYYDQLYPGYDFTSNKGYGTKKHLAALAENGPCGLHRTSFEPIKSFYGGNLNARRTSIFNQRNN
ncbi:MAG: ribonuclease HII [Syntrophomonadaceae bacterium]|jgi:ribonuclease HII|nr:ribonuclease HII [Syntrophomonadaceae bacterium]